MGNFFSLAENERSSICNAFMNMQGYQPYTSSQNHIVTPSIQNAQSKPNPNAMQKPLQSRSRSRSRLRTLLPIKLILQNTNNRLRSPLHSSPFTSSHLGKHIIRNSIILPTLRSPNANPNPQHRQIPPPFNRIHPLPPQTFKRTNQPPMPPQTRRFRPTPLHTHFTQRRLKLIVQYDQRRRDADWGRDFEASARWSDKFVSL